MNVAPLARIDLPRSRSSNLIIVVTVHFPTQKPHLFKALVHASASRKQ